MTYAGRSLFFTLLLATSACSVPITQDSPYYTIPSGSALILRQALTIPPNSASVYLQYGKVQPRSHIDLYYPNCHLEVLTVSPQEQTVVPDTFIIIRVKKEMDYVSADQPHFIPAALRMVSVGGNPIDMVTMLFLRSERQADVYRLVCKHWEDHNDNNHLSLPQIRSALGEVFELQIYETGTH